MKPFRNLSTAVLPVLILAGSGWLGIVGALAQQSGSTMPVANPTFTPGAADTPAPFAQGGSVENPPPTPDPNAPIETEILASNGANFASKERIAVFMGDVRVNDPRFQLACDKLTVYLNKSDSSDGAAGNKAAGMPTPRPNNTPPPGGNGSSDQNNPGGGIDHAKAEGRVIIIQKRAATKPGEEPKVSIGRANWATFDNKTGDMVLHGWPSVEQNGNTHKALLETTVMTLHKDNSMDTEGPTRTVITSRKGGNGIDLPGSSPAASPASQGGKKPKNANGAKPGTKPS